VYVSIVATTLQVNPAILFL